MMKTNTIPRDGALESPWQKEITVGSQASFNPAQIYDCLVVGGGITGLTAALLLQLAGKRTLLADANGIGFGTTGGTSAHINTFADTTYQEAESAFGAEGAQLFADAVNEGFALIKKQINVHRIECDYESKPGYVYAENKDEAKLLEKIYLSAKKVSVAVAYSDEVPTPVPFQKALLWEGQAQFHPLKYLMGLQSTYLAAGGVIREHTRVEQIEQNDKLHIAGDIRARAVIYATHTPPNINLFNFECAPYRSYVLAVKLHSGQYPDALIYDSQEPYHYVRSHKIDGEQLLLVGGLDHKTGHGDPEKAFAELEKYARKYYHISSVKYRWSSQYYVPADGLPYIGKMPMTAAGIYCATGYNGNGMMLGSIAGQILADLVSGKPNKYEKVFSPSRIKPVDSFSELVKENTDVAYHFFADRLNFHASDSLNRLQPGTGKLVEIDGQHIAAYKGEDGIIHALSPVCTHAGCIVNWNSEEKSWDCPCHGARYDIDGRVLTGPATRDLAKLNSEEAKA